LQKKNGRDFSPRPRLTPNNYIPDRLD
jgi:hypothetical protein